MKKPNNDFKHKPNNTGPHQATTAEVADCSQPTAKKSGNNIFRLTGECG